jgi:hypothetical protein
MPGDVMLFLWEQALGNIPQDRAQMDTIMNAGSLRLERNAVIENLFLTTLI